MSERSTSELHLAPLLETSDDVPSELFDVCFNNIILPSCTLLTQGVTQDCGLQEYKQFFCGSSKCERGSPTKTIPTAESIQFREREREMFYLTTHSTHFIYGYMASDIWLRTILIVRKETRCRHIGYSYRLTSRGILYAPSHRQDNTYHGLCYTSRGALAGKRNSSMGPSHEGSIRRPTAP